MTDIRPDLKSGHHPRAGQAHRTMPASASATTFGMVRIASRDPALITPELARIGRAASRPSAAISAAFIDALPKLEIIASFGVGYDWVDAAHAGKRRVMVTNTPDVLTEEVADTTIGLLINTVRELSQAETYLRAGRWVEEGAYPLTRGTLRGRRAGIFGMGRIGLAIARRLEAFGLSGGLSQPPARSKGSAMNTIRPFCRWPIRSIR